MKKAKKVRKSWRELADKLYETVLGREVIVAREKELRTELLGVLVGMGMSEVAGQAYIVKVLERRNLKVDAEKLDGGFFSLKPDKELIWQELEQGNRVIGVEISTTKYVELEKVKENAGR